MSKEEFMALSAEEMYNKYAEAEGFRKSNLESMIRYSEKETDARKECEELKCQIGVLKGVIKSLSEIL